MYKVDRRYGSNEEYKALIDAAHEKDMKVIMDMIHNHIGDQHWWMNDLPTADWISSWDEEGMTSFRGSVTSDPYASEYDLNRLTRGWFNRRMPDLNNQNELLADYLIQNTIWWIEYTGVDGIRMDTYVYPDKEYMARWAKEVLEAYPDFNIVGEVWVNKAPIEAWWQYDPEGIDDGYNSHLPSVTDFPFANAARAALNEDFGWLEGLRRLYYVFAQDMGYADPYQNVIFLDNHDMGRIYETVGKNEAHFKMLYAFLMTTRGIPQVYYGTELMMEHENRGGDDEGWRQTIPGGFPGDSRSVFTADGRTDKENEILDYISALTNWRKDAVAVHEGKMVHFIPEKDIYVYFRVHDEQTVMVVMNNNKGTERLSRDRFSEILDGFTTAQNVLNGEIISVTEDFEVAGKTTSVFELK
jgi:glycosidase